MAEYARQGVIEIQSHGPRQLQRAFQLLLERKPGFGGFVLLGRAGRRFGRQLKQKEFFAIFGKRADGNGECCAAAAARSEFYLDGRSRRPFPLRKELLGDRKST